MVGIYKITSPSGKVYVGQSSNIPIRFSYYLKLRCKQQKKLYNSLKKYGVENHKFEVIEECNFFKLNERERYWQEYYNVLIDGLNLVYTNTLDLNRRVSQETKQRMSESQKGKLYSDETKLKFSKRMSGNELFKGKTHTLEVKKLISKKQIGNNKRGKIVLDISNGVYYYSAKEVSDLYKINRYTLVNKLNGFKNNNTNFLYV